MTAIITENTAVAIAMAHREIASAEKLLKDLLDAESRNQVARMELDGVLPPPQTEQAS